MNRIDIKQRPNKLNILRGGGRLDTASEKSNLHKYYKHIVPIFPFCSLCLINSSQTVQAPPPERLLLCTPSAAALSPDGQNSSSELTSNLVSQKWKKPGSPMEKSFKEKARGI